MPKYKKKIICYQLEQNIELLVNTMLLVSLTK